MNLLIASFWVGQLNRYLWPGSLLGRVNLLDVVVGVLIALYLLKRGSVKLNPWLIGFVSITIVSAVWGFALFDWQGQPEAFFYLIRLIIYILFFGVVGELLGQRAYQIGSFIGLGIAVLGFIQLSIFPTISLRLTEVTGFDPHSGRLFSTFFDPNYAAIVLVITILLTLALAWSSKGRWQYGYWLSAAVQLLALGLTQSRSGLLALAIGLIIFLTAINWRYTLVALVLGLGVALYVPSISTRIKGALAVDATSQARFASWDTAFMVIKRQPILGVGYNNYQTATVEIGRLQPRIGQIELAANASDSSLLTVWATTGIFGVIVFIGWLLSEAAGIGSASRLGLAQLATRRAVIAALLINSLFLNSLLWPFGLFLLALTLSPVEQLKTKS